MYPDFLIVGAQKAGTTWLYRNLRAHSQVWMPHVKELHYFDEKVKITGGPLDRISGDRPEDVRWRRQFQAQMKRYPKKLVKTPIKLFAGEVAWDLGYFLRRPNDEWYASLFEPGRGRITGEATPDYSVLGPEEISRVHALMPHAKIIFFMRNPVERAWSAASMAFRVAGQDAGWLSNEELRPRLVGDRTRKMTDYLRTLESWGRFYPPEQIFVGFIEDIHFFPAELLEHLYAFLGTDPSAGYRVITDKVHSGAGSTIPTRAAAFLGAAYLEEARRLDERFGGYASFWLYCADRLTNRPPAEGSIPYPLGESSIWQDWVNGSGGPSGPNTRRVRSGRLSELQNNARNGC